MMRGISSDDDGRAAISGKIRPTRELFKMAMILMPFSADFRCCSELQSSLVSRECSGRESNVDDCEVGLVIEGNGGLKGNGNRDSLNDRVLKCDR